MHRGIWRALALSMSVAIGSSAPAQAYKTTRYNIGGDGGTDYLSVDPTSGRVFISRATHVMVVDGKTGKVVGDIPDTPRVHGIAFAPNGMGFTTNGGDSTSTMFDVKTLAVKAKIKAGKDGLDGIMFDDATGMILTINHSKPQGSAVVIDPRTGKVVATVALNSTSPEGGTSDGQGRIFINLEDKNAIDVVDTKTWKVVATWPIAPCDGPTGIAMDRTTQRIFSACSDTSVVTDASTGKVVARFANGDGVDAIGWDPAQKLVFIPAGVSGNVTVVHEDGPNAYRVVATVPTFRGAKTIGMDNPRKRAFVFTPEYGPSTQPTAPGGRATRGPVIAAWLIAITR